MSITISDASTSVNQETPQPPLSARRARQHSNAELSKQSAREASVGESAQASTDKEEEDTRDIEEPRGEVYEHQSSGRTTYNLEDQRNFPIHQIHLCRETTSARQSFAGITTTHSRNTEKLVGKVTWSVLLVSVCLLGFYPVVFFAVLGISILLNIWFYGPVHTDYTDTTIDERPATIITGNTKGMIYTTVMITDVQGHLQTQTIQGPTLDSETWGDVRAIVAKNSIQQTQGLPEKPTIVVTLTGNMNYLHLLFERPTLSYELVPDVHGIYHLQGPV
jgi:hypothetical protein